MIANHPREWITEKTRNRATGDKSVISKIKEKEGELKMKTALTLFSAIAVTCALAMPAAAQYATQSEVNSFNSFLNNHPNVAEQLRRDPGLIDSKAYLDEHPELHNYLNNHSQLRQAIQMHPGAFTRDSAGRYTYGWGRYGSNWNRQAWEESHNYGYWDPQTHQWHDRYWWEHNRADWVREHHPQWAAATGQYHQDYNRWNAEHANAPHYNNGMSGHPQSHPMQAEHYNNGVHNNGQEHYNR